MSIPISQFIPPPPSHPTPCFPPSVSIHLFSTSMSLFSFLFFDTVLLLFFLSLLLLLFLPGHEACGILVPRPQVWPNHLWGELRVQTTGLTENLKPQGILIRVRLPGGPHLNTRTQLYPTA